MIIDEDGINIVKKYADSPKTNFMLLRSLLLDVGSDSDKLKPSFERVFSEKIHGLSTNELYVERVDNNILWFSYLEMDVDQGHESGLYLKKDQLYYLMDEWARLTKAGVKEITISYDEEKDRYFIEGE